MNKKELLTDFVEYAKANHVLPVLQSGIESLVGGYLEGQLRLPETPSFADMVREKLLPLEWRKLNLWHVWETSLTEIGRYGIHQQTDGRYILWLYKTDDEDELPTYLAEYNSEEKAKSAAQQHYTSKVLELFGIQSQPNP